MDVVGGLPGLGQWVHPGEGRMDQTLGDQSVGLPRLAVVREVRSDHALEVHPQIAVVIGVQEAAGGGAGHDRPAAPGDVDGGAEGLPPGMLEDDVGVLAAGEFPDLLAEALPFLRVLGVLVLPEPVVLLGPVDHQLGAHAVHDLGLAGGGDDADRDRAAVEGHLRGVGTEPTAGAPDQHHVALLHARAVARHQLAVGGGVHQAGGGGLLPAQVRGLRHELVRLDQGELGQPPEVRLKAPDALLGVEHRVVVALGTLQLDRQAVGDHLVTGRPGVYRGAGSQHHTGQVGTDHVIWQVMSLAERGEPAVALQETERRERLED